MFQDDAEMAAVVAFLIEQGEELEVAKLIQRDLEAIEGLSEEDRDRIAAEVTVTLFEA